MSAGQTGKQRSQRIQIDYFRHRGGLFYLRCGCIVAGLVAAGLYGALVIGRGGGSHLSTGPLAVVHVSFENDCQQCHQDFTPLASDAFRIDPESSVSHTEQACQKCHQVDGHHRDLLLADWKMVDQNCAICHADHQGRQRDLTAVVNPLCSQCHSDLSKVCTANRSPVVRDQVSRFDLESHGDFASLKSDPGRVKFDHRQHMLPGQVDPGSKGAMTVSMLEATRREQYRRAGQGNDDLVSLDCSSCHQFAGNPDAHVVLAGDQELGRYLKPISFDQHCSACHSMNPPGRTEDTLPLPHAAPWSEIGLLLQTKIAGLRQLGTARSPRDDTQPAPIPGEGFGSAANNVSIVSAAEVDVALKAMQVQCLKCHDSASITDEAINTALAGTSTPLIPARWLRHGIYDHAAHRKMDCRYCHADAYPNEAMSSSPPDDHQQVMIGGIETCTPCHRPADVAEPEGLSDLFSGQPTWASDDCILCHRYHTSVGVKR